MKKFVLLSMMLYWAVGVYAQVGSITGIVSVEGQSKGVANVNISIPSLGLHAISGENGKFNFENLKPGVEYKLQFSCVGFHTVTENGSVGDYLMVNLPLDVVHLRDVEVSGDKLNNLSYQDSSIDLGGWKKMKLLDVPFSMTTLSGDAMKNLQVTSLNEASKYIPSMQIEARGGLEVGRPQTRGFEGSVVECTRLDGMNIVSTTSYPMEQFQQLEVLNGLAGSMYGPASPAGSFNYVAKRVTNAPLKDFSVTYQSKTIGSFYADISNVKKDNKGHSIGYRINGLYGDGVGYVDYSSLNRFFLSAAVDAQLGKVKIETNLSRYNYKQYGYPGGFSYGESIDLPEDLDPTTQGYGQEWGGLNLKTITGHARLIWDISSKWTFTAGILNQQVDRGMLSPGITLTSNSGDYTASVKTSSAAGRFTVLSNIINLTGEATTGNWKHHLTIGTTGFVWGLFKANTTSKESLGSGNIYDPEIFEEPDIPNTDGHYRSGKHKQQGINLGDRIEFSPRLALMLSGSYSWMNNKSYSSSGEISSSYKDGGLCYSGSLVYKIADRYSVYGTYSDVIEEGSVATDGSANEGEVLDPVRCKQYELGAKTSWKNVNFSLAAFRMNRPFPYLDSSDNVYKIEGDQVNKGLEFYTDATIKHLHILGGLTWLDPKLTDTSDSETTDKQVVGVPKLQANLFAEYKLPVKADLSVNANLHHTHKRPANDLNTSWVDGYTTVDLGLRYTYKISGHQIVWNIQGTNLLNTKYWAAIFPGDINGEGSSYSAFLGTPVQFKASVRVIF